MEDQQRIVEFTGMAVVAIAEALKSVKRLPSIDETEPVIRDFWPSRINVSTLAWISTSQISNETAICALAVGSRFPSRASPEMQRGAALHKVVLPLAAEFLQKQGIHATVEQDFYNEELGISGRVDLKAPEIVIELKTTSMSQREPSQYELVQSSLYAYLVAPCVLVMVSIPQKRVFYARLISGSDARELSAGAMELLSRYHRKRNEVLDNLSGSSPLAPVTLGNCLECPCRWICEFRKGEG